MKQFISKIEDKKRLSLDDFKKQKADLNHVLGNATGGFADECCLKPQGPIIIMPDCHTKL